VISATPVSWNLTVAVEDFYTLDPFLECETPLNVTLLPGQTVSVVCTAHDEVGNEDTCEFDLTVIVPQDSLILTCPSELLKFDATFTAMNAENLGVTATSTLEDAEYEVDYRVVLQENSTSDLVKISLGYPLYNVTTHCEISVFSDGCDWTVLDDGAAWLVCHPRLSSESLRLQSNTVGQLELLAEDDSGDLITFDGENLFTTDPDTSFTIYFGDFDSTFISVCSIVNDENSVYGDRVTCNIPALDTTWAEGYQQYLQFMVNVTDLETGYSLVSDISTDDLNTPSNFK
jgi:hypothetical protein